MSSPAIPQPPIVTLTTDWGDSDFFAGRVKGRLLSYIPGVQIVDITHNIEKFQLQSAIFIVKNACFEFPAGTIHIIDVASSEDADHPFLVVCYRDQYFICTDNQLPHALFGNDPDIYNNPDRMVVIDNISHESDFFTFAACDLFCKVSSLLAHGAQLCDLGFPTDDINHYTPFCNIPIPAGIRTHITYIDAYGNADLNLSYEEFERLRNGRKFELKLREYIFTEVSHGYTDDSHCRSNITNARHKSNLLLTVSSTGLLQVAVREDSAERLLGLRVLDSVPIDFK